MVSDERLSDVLCDFARTMVTDFPIQGILDHLVVRIVDLLPIEAAGVALISEMTNPRFIAGSDESAVRYEQLQSALGEGPCLAAYETDQSIIIPDLALENRFPNFVRSARDEGLVAVFTFPLRNHDRCLGALDLYRTSSGGLSARQLSVAQSLADVATAYLLNAQARQAKSDFVATVSHELRTPMTSISGFLELLQDHEGGDLTPDQEDFVNAIRRGSDKLTALADDLLTLSSLESGTFDHEQVDLDLCQVVKSVHSAFSAAIALRRLEVDFAFPDSPVVVQGDAQSLESVVSNLVGNALKFTEDGGWVRCELDVVGGQVLLQVSDNGVGIPKAEQHDLFTRFFRSSTALEREIQGTGLGLNIAESIVQHHGGNIDVVSEHLMGSTFKVTLPLAQTGSEKSRAVAAG